MLHFRLQLSCGKSKYRFIEFFLFNYGSLPYLLSLFFCMGVTFPLVALDEIYMYSIFIVSLKPGLHER